MATKTKILILCLITIILSSFIGCGVPALDENRILIRLASSENGSPDDIIGGHFVMKFEELVEERSNNEIDVLIFPNSQLGDQSETYGSTGTNTIEMSLGAVPNYVSYVPSMSFYVMPYVFEDLEDVREFSANNIDYMNEFCVPLSNSRVLAVGVAGMRSLCTQVPVSSLADIENMIVRTPPNQELVDTFLEWGASPQVLAWTELYSGMEQGVVDAFDTGVWTLIDAKLAEVTDYYVEIDFMPQPNALVISEEFFQTLSPEHQEIVAQAALDAAKNMETVADEVMQNYYDLVEEEGVTVMPAPSDLDTWISIAKEEVWPLSYETLGNGDSELGKEILDYVLAH